MNRENQALSAPMLGTQLHTQRCLCRSQECSWEMRFTRGLLQSIDLSMWSCLPLCLWVSRLGPSSVETNPEKRSSRSAFPRGWDVGFIGGGKSRPPSESKRQPSGLRFEASTWKNGLASPKGDLQICSEVGNSRGSVQGPDCPLPTLQRHS